MLKGQGFSLRHAWSVGFGLGYLPWAPGTWGSLLGLPLGYFLLKVDLWGWLVLALLIFLSVWTTAFSMLHMQQHDPKEIVCDEVVGLLLVLLWVQPQSLLQIAGCFILFRLFDIVKPWPISWVDQNMPTPWGVIVDDLLAGLAAILVYQLVIGLF